MCLPWFWWFGAAGNMLGLLTAILDDFTLEAELLETAKHLLEQDEVSPRY